MKIDFDTSNTAEVAAVLALVRSLSGDAIDMRTFANPDAPPMRYVTTPEHAADVAARKAPDCHPDPTPEQAATDAAWQESTDPFVIGTLDGTEHAEAVAEAQRLRLDSNGREWDERIHSSSRAVNADGSWRYKRGVDKALVLAVEAGQNANERVQRAIAAEAVETPGEPQPVASVPPPPPVAPAPMESAEAAATTASDVPPPPPVAAAPVEQPGQQPVTPALTFADLMKRIGAAKRDGTLTDEQVASYCGALGIGGLADLASRADLVPAFGELVA